MTPTATQAEKGGIAVKPKVGWSQPVAQPGQTVFLGAQLVGYAPDSEVTFKVFEAGEDPGSALATLKGVTNAKGLAVAQWTVRYDMRRRQVPYLLFEASTPETSSISPMLTIVDVANLAMQEEGGNSISGLSLSIVDCAGKIHFTKIPADGRIEKVLPIGEFSLVLKDHLVVGEEVAGQKLFETGKAHEVTWKKMTYSVEITSFKDGEVYLAGDQIPVETVVKRAGKVEEVEPQIVVSGNGKLRGGADAGQGAARGTGDVPTVILADDEGEVTIEASYMGGKTTAKLKVIRPYVRSIELVDNGGNLVLLFDHKDGKPKPPRYEFLDNGRVLKVHPGAAKFGTKLKAKIGLYHEDKPSKPTKLEVAIFSQKLDDKGLAPPSERKLANRPLTLRLAEGQREEGVELKGDWENEVIEVEADRELPACIRENLLQLEARMRVKGESGWSGNVAKPKTWTPIAKLAPVPVFGIWKKPEVGNGTPQKPGAAPLKKSELDAFHLHHATAWAEGGFNLRADHDGSILKRLLDRIGHYRYPDGYEGKEGKGAGAHKRPENLEALSQKGISRGEVKAAAAPEPDDKLEVKVSKRGGRKRRGNQTNMSLKVVTTGALEVEVEMDKAHRAKLKVMVLVDGKELAKTGLLKGGESTGRLKVGPVKPGPHVITISPEIESRFPTLASWKGKATIHFSKPKPGEAKPQDKNWGFSVLDNPSTPGGKSHQAASAVAAALNVLGVKATVNMIKARKGGAINLKSHDPITLGASCFDPEKHWGQNVIAFAAVPKDDSRDGEALLEKLKPLCEEKTLVLDLERKRISTVEETAKTGHARRMPNREKLVKKQCRCGEEWPPKSWFDWASRIKSGAPFILQLSEVPATKEQWGTIKPGGRYTIRFNAPDSYTATGPANKEVELSASLDGRFWSFSEWPGGKGKSGHGGRAGKHMIEVDPGTGTITPALGGGKGTYTIRFYKNKKQVGPDVATCHKSLRRLRLTKAAERLGWKRQGKQLVPPPDLVEGNVAVTSTYKDSGTVPDKLLINLWGHPLEFDNTGAVTDPAFPELGVVGKLDGGSVPPFPADEERVFKTFPIRALGAYKRRWHHWFSHRVERFEADVDTEGLLNILPAVPHGPHHLHVHFRIFVDGKHVGSQVVPAQKPKWIESKVAKGTHKVKVVSYIRGHGPAPAGVHAAITVQTSKAKDPIKKHPISGAQPCWAYKLDGKLKDALIQSIIYPCPKCEVTVHEEDADCWACGHKLEKRDVTEGWTK